MSMNNVYRDCETSRIPHFLYNRLTDGSEVVGLTRLPPLTPMKIPGTHFCCIVCPVQGHSAAGRVRSIEKSSNLIEKGSREIPGVVFQKYER
jgi:hypothetical protein